jgi:hypothetical protein
MALKGTLAVLLVLSSTLLATGQKISGPEFNKPFGGPPASYFQAAATIPVAALQTAATGLSESPGNAVADYKLSSSSKQMSTIYTDWAEFDGVSRLFLFKFPPQDLRADDDDCYHRAPLLFGRLIWMSIVMESTTSAMWVLPRLLW